MKVQAKNNLSQEKKIITSLFLAIFVHLIVVFIFRDLTNFDNSAYVASTKLLKIKLVREPEETKPTSPEIKITEPTNESHIDNNSDSPSETIPSPTPEITYKRSDKKRSTILLSEGSFKKWIADDTKQSFDENSESYTRFENSFKSPSPGINPRRNESDYLNSLNKSIDVRNNNIAHVQTKVFGRSTCYKFDANPSSHTGTLDGGSGSFGVVSVAFPYKCPSKKSLFQLSKN